MSTALGTLGSGQSQAWLGSVGSAGNCTIIIDFELCLTRNVDVFPASQHSAFCIQRIPANRQCAFTFSTQLNRTPKTLANWIRFLGLACDCIGNLFAAEVKYLIIANTRSAKNQKNQPAKRVWKIWWEIMVQQLWQCLPKSFNGNLLAQSKRFSFGILFLGVRLLGKSANYCHLAAAGAAFEAVGAVKASIQPGIEVNLPGTGMGDCHWPGKSRIECRRPCSLYILERICINKFISSSSNFVYCWDFLNINQNIS